MYISNSTVSWGTGWSTGLCLVDKDVESPIKYVITEDDSGWTFLNNSTSKYTFIATLIGADDSAYDVTEDYYGLGAMYIDKSSGAGNYHFTISEQDASTPSYRIQVVATDATYGNKAAEGCYWGYIKGDNVYPYAVYAFLNPNDNSNYRCDWEFIDYTIYEARMTLYETLGQAAEYGADTSEASAIYNNNDATLEEITDATDALNEAIKQAMINKATEDDPYDFTFLIDDCDFESGDIANSKWETTFIQGTTAGEVDYKKYTYPKSGVEPAESYINHEGNEVSPTVGNSWFFQVWSSTSNTYEDGRYIGNGQLSQTLTDMPEGKYILGADIIAVNQDDDTVDVTGTQLFAIGGGIDNYVAVATANNVPQHFTLEITGTSGELIIGIRTNGTDANWIAADNFELMYYGKTANSPYYTLLENNIEAATTYTETDNYHYSASTLEKLETAISSAEALLESSSVTDEELEAASNELQDIITDVQTEIKAYNDLLALTEQVINDRDKYEESLSDLSDMLSDMYDEYNDAYYDCSASVDEINEWINAYETYVVDYIKEHLGEASEEHPIDITALCTNMDYSGNSISGWTVTMGGSGSNSVSYHNSEVYEDAFSCLQSIENMPAGSYTLTAKAFSRNSSNQANYTDYISGSTDVLTYLTVGLGKTYVKNHAVGAIEADEAPYTGYKELSSNAGIWVPNSQQAAEYAFQDDTYLCEATGYLAADGTLTFGICNDGPVESEAWSCWTQFNLYYNGTSANGLYTALMQLLSEAMILQDKVYELVPAAYEKLDDAIILAGDMDMNSNEEDIINATAVLQEAINYGNESFTLMSSLMETYDIYWQMYTNIESGDEVFPAFMDVVGTSILNENFISNEQMEEWIANMKATWTVYVQYDHLDATKENPADISEVIINPSFDVGTNNGSGATGWTITFDGTGHIGYSSELQQQASDNAYEVYNATEFDMQQTVTGLAEGYYHLTAKGMYEPGNYSADVAAKYLVNPEDYEDFILYANTASVPLKCIYEDAQTEATGASTEKSYTYQGTAYYIPYSMQDVKIYFDLGCYFNELDFFVGEGEDLVLGIKMVNAVSRNWVVFDDFTLSYMGNGEENAPTAVENVEAATASSIATIYDLQGRKQQKLQKGINIVVTKAANGTTEIKKVLIK